MKNKDSKLFLKTLQEISGRLDEISLLLEEYIQLIQPKEVINITSTDTKDYAQDASHRRLKGYSPGYPSRGPFSS